MRGAWDPSSLTPARCHVTSAMEGDKRHKGWEKKGVVRCPGSAGLLTSGKQQLFWFYLLRFNYYLVNHLNARVYLSCNLLEMQVKHILVLLQLSETQILTY